MNAEAAARVPEPVPAPTEHPSLDDLTAGFTRAVIDIRKHLPDQLKEPQVGIVCGSGLQGLAELLEDRTEVPYEKIEGFAQSTVKGHSSMLAFGLLGPKRIPVVCQLGRFHAYEGHDLAKVVMPVRVMKLLGAHTVVVTNAAGGLNTSLEVGSVLAIQDHISLPSLTAMNPLIGKNSENLGPRFPPMSDAYDFELRRLFFHTAKKLGLWDVVGEGTYAWVSGPTYETKAEQRFLQAAGADVVGMSTIPEVIAARHVGLRVLAISLVTNIVAHGAYRSAKESVLAELEQRPEAAVAEEIVASHAEVLDVSARRANDVRTLVEQIITDMPQA